MIYRMIMWFVDKVSGIFEAIEDTRRFMKRYKR